WGALPLRDDTYAVEKYTIRHLVSGRDLVSPPAAGKTARPLLMADPDYDLAPAGTAGAASGATALGLGPVGRLPGTLKEAKAVAPRLRNYAGVEPQFVTGRDATEAVFKAARRPRVVVLSTHGYFLEDAAAEGRPRGPLDNPLLRCGL